MKLTRSLPTQPHRDAWCEINLAALEHNVSVVRDAIGHLPVLMAIVKADAYGHGSVMCLPTLLGAGITQLGVASIDEALQIRDAGFGDVPILVVGPTPAWAVESALRRHIALSVFDEAQVQHIVRVVQQQQLPPAQVQVKVDTGMHRIGVAWEHAAEFVARCQGSPELSVEGVFSHLAWTGNAEFCQTQHQRFQDALSHMKKNPQALPKQVHLLNSAGAVLYPELMTTGDVPYTAIRLGLALWGYSESEAIQSQLRPVMQLKSRVAYLQTVPASEGISYNHTNTALPSLNETRTIATLPVGYADGVPRGLSNQMIVVARGVNCPQVGTITMDQLMVDVTAAEGISVGDTVTLFGGDTEISLTDWAKIMGTIEYELMCGLRVRLPRTYTR